MNKYAPLRRGPNTDLALAAGKNLVAAMFSREDLCASLVRCCLPRALQEGLADRPPVMEHLEPQDKSLPEVCADVVLKVFLKPGGEGDYMHFLLLYKPDPDWGIHAQLMGCHAALMKRQLAAHGADREFRYRPIMKWVLYNGTEPWPVPLHSYEQTKMYGSLTVAATLQTHSGYKIIDLRQIPDEVFLSPPSPTP